MSAVIMDGKALAEKIKAQMITEVEQYKRRPHLHVIQIGDDFASSLYVRNTQKDCEECGIRSSLDILPEQTTEAELLAIMKVYENNMGVDGLLIQLPLPAHINEEAVFNAIPPDKDVDCLHPINAGKLYSGAFDALFKPCAAAGIMALLEEYKLEPEGKRAVVLGRSDIVGEPVAKLLRDANATVTICHSHTSDKDIWKICNDAHILISAVGKPDFILADMVRPGATVIDVGINRRSDGQLMGDVEAQVCNVANYITPVPDGVGPMTRAMLMKNILRAYKRKVGIVA